MIGVGNDLRRDDGAGPAAVEGLRKESPGRFTLTTHHGEGTGLIEAWRGADTVVLIDATRSGAAPGTVQRFDVDDTPLPSEMFRCSSHQFGVAEAVEMARILGRLPRRLVVYGIEGAAFDYGEDLSPEVRRAVAEVTRRIATDEALAHSRLPSSSS